MHGDEHSLGSSISGHYLGEESILPSPTHTNRNHNRHGFRKSNYGVGGVSNASLSQQVSGKNYILKHT